MKYLLIFFVFIFGYSCSAGDKNDSNIGTIKTNVIDTIVVHNIKKNCDKNINQNIYNYKLCSEWSLNEYQIKNILTLGKKDENPEILNLLANETPSWIFADLKLKNQAYKIEINNMSYYYLTDKKGNRELYTFDIKNKEKVKKYFTRILSEDDDEDYENKLQKIKKELENNSEDIKQWKGIFTFDNNNYEQLYKKYTLNIEADKIVLYEGSLPGCEIYCIPLITDNELYLYYNGNKTNCSSYDTTLINNLQDGDLLVKLYKKSNKNYLVSAIIKYWDDGIADFKQNVPIELTRED